MMLGRKAGDLIEQHFSGYIALCATIGYNFKNPSLLLHAITHSSREAGYSYERLEFLGDAVLEFIVSAYLFHKYPKHKEGQLTALRANIVREEYLASWASENRVGDYLVIGKGEENSGGREKSSILCDVMESIIGALYLDGGIEVVQKFIERILAREDPSSAENDPKTALQIELQKEPANTLIYKVYKSAGPPHNMTFYVNAVLNGKVLSSGEGKSKKQAEQCAAKEALKLIRSGKQYKF